MKSDDMESMIDSIHKKIEKVQNIGELQGRNPGAVAGALVYLLAAENGQSVTQREIARAIGITETTIRNCCKILRSCSPD
jgi:transcription initiation factor TFIIIB Brf1 subunit/transcription initiation factor TFIIB